MKSPFSAFTGEGNKGEAFTRKSLFHSFLPSYGEEVKAKNEKQRARALRVRVGAEVGGRCTFEKGLLIVDTSLQMSDESKDGTHTAKKHRTRQKQKFETSKAACYKRIA